MVSNLSTYFSSTAKIRGGEAVWVKDGNGERRCSVPLGCTIANPPKGFGHIWAAQLFQFNLGESGYLFRSFSVKANVGSADRTIYIKADGYSDNPEVGMALMKAPKSLKVASYVTSSTSGTKQKVRLTVTAGCTSNGSVIVSLDGANKKVAVTTAASTAAAVAALIGAATYSGYDVEYTAENAYVDFTATEFGDKASPSFDGASTGVESTVEETVEGSFAVIASESDYTGQSAIVTAVTYEEANSRFVVTVDTALGALSANDILVEAEGTEASASASVLVPNPNSFIEADEDLLPSDGSLGIENVSHSYSPVYDKKAFVQRMQPLPEYVLAKNKSLIDGIFWI